MNLMNMLKRFIFISIFYLHAGLVFPGASGQVDPNQYGAYQQNLQRAFLQSAVAQNIQIQQHLMAQNQALQQLIQQNVSFLKLHFS